MNVIKENTKLLLFADEWLPWYPSRKLQKQVEEKNLENSQIQHKYFFKSVAFLFSSLVK